MIRRIYALLTALKLYLYAECDGFEGWLRERIEETQQTEGAGHN
jgi:hypothetical protein